MHTKMLRLDQKKSHTMKNIVKRLREAHDISQTHMAYRLGISRPTLMAVEKGERDLTLSEIRKLAEMFEISPSDILEGKIPGLTTPKIKMTIPKGNLQKFKEVLLYILEKIGAKPNVGQTVLYKILYFIDFDYYEKYEQKLIGATYMKNHYGPTPVEFAKVVKEMEADGELEEMKSTYFQHDQTKYIPVRSPNLALLTGQELGHIDEELQRFGDWNAKKLSDYSHGDIPWILHGQGEVIDYNSVFQREGEYAQNDYEAMMMQAGADDCFASLGPISKEEYDYYMNLPDKK